MSTILHDSSLKPDIDGDNSDAGEYDQFSLPRQDLCGGSGVFANFFEELASPLPNLCNEHTAPRYPVQGCSFNFYEDDQDDFQNEYNPMNAFYENNNNEDLLISHQNYALGENEVYPKGDYQTICHELTDTDSPQLINPFCISYTQRSKPPKLLANRFLLGDTIGQGSYGKVKDAIDLFTLNRHAVKIISKPGVRKIPGGWNQALHEAAVMRRLPYSLNIVHLICTLRLESPDRVCLVMEHCLGSVHDLQTAGVPFAPSALDEDDFDNNHHNEDSPAHHSFSPDRLPPQHLYGVRKKQSLIDQPKDLYSDLIEDHQSVKSRRKLSEWKPPTRSNQFFANANSHRNDDGDDDDLVPIQQFRRLHESQAHAYFIQLIDALHFLHRNGVIHRDVKPANLLLIPQPGFFSQKNNVETNVDRDLTFGDREYFSSRTYPSLHDLLCLSRGWIIKLTDFGVSASVSPFSTNNLVNGGQTTPAVQPPEVAKGVDTLFDGTKLDIYSAGVSLYFMLTGHVPFSCHNVLQIFEAIVKGDYVIPGYVSADAADIIRRMMHKDPKKRISLLGIRNHRWYTLTPTRPVPISKIKENLRSVKSHSTACHTVAASSRSSSCGTICWLNPFYYLKRPLTNREYSWPHIDETGARLFSDHEIQQCNEEDEEDRWFPVCSASVPNADISSSSPIRTDLVHDEVHDNASSQKLIAPFSVMDRLRNYHHSVNQCLEWSVYPPDIDLSNLLNYNSPLIDDLDSVTSPLISLSQITPGDTIQNSNGGNIGEDRFVNEISHYLSRTRLNCGGNAAAAGGGGGDDKIKENGFVIDQYWNDDQSSKSWHYTPNNPTNSSLRLHNRPSSVAGQPVHSNKQVDEIYYDSSDTLNTNPTPLGGGGGNFFDSRRQSCRSSIYGLTPDDASAAGAQDNRKPKFKKSINKLRNSFRKTRNWLTNSFRKYCNQIFIQK